MDTKVTLYIDKDAWLTFRAACIVRELVAGRVLEQAIRDQLKAWDKQSKDKK